MSRASRRCCCAHSFHSRRLIPTPIVADGSGGNAGRTSSPRRIARRNASPGRSGSPCPPPLGMFVGLRALATSAGALAIGAVSASRNAPALGHRSSGFFDNARSITAASCVGTSGRLSRTGLGISDRCLTSIAGVFAALNGVWPTSI